MSKRSQILLLFLLILFISNCAKRTMVVLVPDPDGKVGNITVSNQAGSVTIDKRIIEIHPGQKAIIASGYSKSERVKELQKLGAGAYLLKPYTLEKIGVAVRQELDHQS